MNYLYTTTSPVIVPETIDGLPVVNVNGFFGRESSLEAIVFPDTCTSITGFWDYLKLKSVTLPENITEIEENTFKDCTSLESITIPASVIKIGSFAFSGCSSLTSVEFNEGLLNICEMAFQLCNLQSLNLPSTLTRIQQGAFRLNPELKTVTIPSSVTEIGKEAFSKCGLETVKAHNGITSMGFSAFKCENLTEVTGLTNEQIASFWTAFNNTPWVQTLVDENNPYIVDKNGKLVAYVGTASEVVIPDGVKVIGESAFVGEKITSIAIPSTVVEIEKIAFYDCDNLTDITIPSSVTKIGQLSFSHCDNLKNITFEYGTTLLSLGSDAFQFTAVTDDTLITNNRRYANKATAFRNTALDPDYATTEKPEQTEEPTTEPTEKPTEKPTSEPVEQEVLTVTSTADGLIVATNGKEVDFGEELPFIDENGRTQIPIRAVAEALGCEVSWDEETYTATLTKGDKTVIIKIGSADMQSGNEIITMDTTAQIVNDRTYIPVRFAGEALGLKVEWVNE